MSASLLNDQRLQHYQESRLGFLLMGGRVVTCGVYANPCDTSRSFLADGAANVSLFTSHARAMWEMCNYFRSCSILPGEEHAEDGLLR
jgi:hypothetical protein